MKNLLINLLIILISFIIILTYKSEFDEFISNPKNKELIDKYYAKDEIKSKAELLEKLKENGVNISLRTLTNYLTRLKKCLSRIGVVDEIQLDIRQCYSKQDKKTLYLIGHGSVYRKFYKTNENAGNIYLTCVRCRILYEKNRAGLIAHAIIRDGKLDQTKKILHNPCCIGEALEQLVSEQIDRSQRRDLSECSVDPKSIWREGAERARQHDLAEDIEIEDESGLAFNYPTWTSVRSAYYKRRQRLHGHDSSDPFDIQERLQLTRHGAIKLVLKKPLNADDMWLQYRNREKGTMLFMTHIQRMAASHCRILVSDGTFDLAPINFGQIWSIHGLMETEHGSEWTPLLLAFMKKRTQDSYEILLEQLKEKWGDAIISRILRIHTDYETGEVQSLQKFFGTNRVYGCVVHFIRATIRHIQSNRPTLYAEFRRKGDVWKWIRRCFALPFLRKAEIRKMWPILKSFKNDFNGELREEMNSFVVYFNNQWIVKIDKGNMFSFNKLSRTRNTNPVEAWHSLIKRDTASVRHASLQNTLNYFQTIFAESDERTVKLLHGKIKPRPRDAKYTDVDNKIQNAINEYEEMIDRNEISDEEFGSSTTTYLNRLSYLLLQLDDNGISTRKDMKIRERKKEKQNQEKLIETESGLLIDSEQEFVIERESELVIENEPELVIERDSGLVIESSEIMAETDSSTAVILVNRIEEKSPSQEVQHVATMGRATIKFLFNPPDTTFQQEICDTWEYECGMPLQYRSPFEFVTDNYGPGDVLEILADGNCGWRALSLSLTSTQENHEMIRRDVIEYLEDIIYRSNLFNHHDNDWWTLFHDLPTIRTHIEQAISPALDAGDVERWMDNIDLAAAAKMFRINIAVCERLQSNLYRWQLYTRELHTSFVTLNQIPETATTFLFYRGNHYELIKEPKLITF